MKRFVIILLLIIISIYLFYVLFLNKQKEELKIPPKDLVNEEKKEDNLKPLYTASGYKTVWLSVNDPKKLYLYSNLDDKLSAKDLATKYSCSHLVSGGFYSTDGKHIGLFISEELKLNNSVENNLLNGYLSLSKTGIATITDYPVFSPRISIQTGPVLIKNSQKVYLDIRNDENARRLISAVAKDKKLLFIAIYDQVNNFSGPKLADLPDIIKKLDTDKNLALLEAINLDGGTHSAFLTDLTVLNEASPIGSFFCIKP